MESDLNLIIQPGGKALVAEANGQWISERSLEGGLERLGVGDIHGCLIHESFLEEDGHNKVRSIRQVDRRVPVVLAQSGKLDQLSAWLLGADGGLPAAGLDLAEAKSTLERARKQRQTHLGNSKTGTERRVLVVDDDEFLLPALCDVLEIAGFHVLSADNASQALELLHREEVHVMLTDIMMPKISGTQLVAAASSYAPQLVPLVITGLPGIDAAVESIRAGAQDFLVKPVEPLLLVQRVERAWRRWLLGWRNLVESAATEGTRILLVEESPADAARIDSQLNGSTSDPFTLSIADSLDSAIQFIEKESFDVVLLDLDLPDSRGLETFAVFRKAAGSVPVLALTTSPSEELAERVVLCGAQDYIHKTNTTGPVLWSRILYSIERAEMIRKLEGFALDVRASDVSRRRNIERNSEAVVVISQDGVVRFLNPAAEALFAVDMDVVIGAPFAYEAEVAQLVECQIARPGDVRFVEIRTDETQWEGESAKLVSIRDVTDRKRSEHKLKELADELSVANTKLERLSTYDVLTEVFNRRGLLRWLAAELNRASRDGGSTAALLIDCDEFKLVNDTFGHSTGDRALQETARRIVSAVRDEDAVGRIGGDEFLVILPNTQVKEAVLVGERIRLAVSDGELLQGEKVTMTVSVGVARVPSSANGIDTVLELTQAALHRSKTGGKNQVRGAESGDFVAPTTADMLVGLLGESAMRALWQPIVEIASDAVVGYELLSRGPKGGFESPVDFLRLARNQDRLAEVDLHCLDVCLAAVRRLDTLPEGLVLHSNLFPSTLFTIPPDELIQRIDPKSLPATLCLELSEQEFVGLSEDLAGRLSVLKKEGIQIAIDDVGGIPGTVETALMVEPDVLKIDRLLVHGSSEDPLRGRLLGRLLHVANSLGIEVIAEGVERKADATLLQTLGIKHAQGFLWSKPVPVPTD